jgi:hypothetical protein
VFFALKKQPKPQSAQRNTHKERKEKYKVAISGFSQKIYPCAAISKIALSTIILHN